MARVEGEHEIIGDAFAEILPGEVVAGLDYEAWRQLPEGPVLITIRDGKFAHVEPEETE